jgi:hypothetical protein
MISFISFVLFSGGTHLVEVLNTHPDISILKEFPVFAKEQIRGGTALAQQMGDTENGMDELLKGNLFHTT